MFQQRPFWTDNWTVKHRAMAVYDERTGEMKFLARVALEDDKWRGYVRCMTTGISQTLTSDPLPFMFSAQQWVMFEIQAFKEATLRAA